MKREFGQSGMSVVADLLYRLVPKPKPRNPLRPVEHSVDRILVLSKGSNPTFSYYLEERIRHCSKPVIVRDLTERLEDLDPRGLFVIICRYIKPRQLIWLLRNRKKLAGVALFVDDDLAAAITTENSDLAYKAYLVGIGILPVPLLNRVLTGLWASTPVLAKALGGDGDPRIALLEPLPPAHTYTHRPDIGGEDGARVTMAFHATGIHDAEHRFLIPIVRQALHLRSDLLFEVVATGKLAQLWQEAGLPPERLTILPGRSWVRYLDETARRRVDILLVPLLRSRVNDVRSGTKRFDAMRMGAAAVFSRCPVYQYHADGNEILLEDDPGLWVDTIGRLAEDPVLRHRTREATACVVARRAASVAKAFPIEAGGVI